MFPALQPDGHRPGSFRYLATLWLLLVSLAIAVLASPALGQAADFVFVAGDAVVADTDALNVRSAPGNSSAVIGVLHGGDGMTVLAGPVPDDGYTWYEVETAAGAHGWVAGEYLHLGSGEDAKPFIAGETVAVDTDRLNLRAGPSLAAAVLEVFARGKVVTVTGDSTMADGYVWYPVEGWSTGPVSGWVAGMYLVQVMSPPEDDESIGFPAQSTVRVDTDSLNVRTGPGLAYAVIRQLAEGTVFMIGSGPVIADGYSWYTVLTPDQPTPGWVAGEHLALVPGGGSGNQGGMGFAPGDMAIVDTARLNARTGPGLQYGVEQILSGGADVKILDGPVSADSYQWYQVETDTGAMVWVIGEGLAASSGNKDARFGLGETAIVATDGLNLRSAPGGTAPIVQVLPEGAAVTITGSPMTAVGYTWYPVRTDTGTSGWVAGEYLS